MGGGSKAKFEVHMLRGPGPVRRRGRVWRGRLGGGAFCRLAQCVPDAGGGQQEADDPVYGEEGQV